MNTTTEGQHVAILNPASAEGLLTPPPQGDVIPTDRDRTRRALHASGWEPLTDEWEFPLVIAALDNGHTVFGLEARNSADRSSNSHCHAAVLGLVPRLGA